VNLARGSVAPVDGQRWRLARSGGSVLADDALVSRTEGWRAKGRERKVPAFPSPCHEAQAVVLVAGDAATVEIDGGGSCSGAARAGSTEWEGG